MTTKTLISIVETRMKSSDGNPTSGNLLSEIHNALQRLDAYESKYKLIKDKTEQECCKNLMIRNNYKKCLDVNGNARV